MKCDIMGQISAIAEAFPIGRAQAVKRGRNPVWPYIAVVVDYLGKSGATHNPLGRRAFATRDEAVAAADHYIMQFREGLRIRLADPRWRALREQYGLPRDLPSEGIHRPS